MDIGGYESGLGTASCRFGTWRGDELGRYTLCAVLVVFNDETDNATAHLYTVLIELLERKESGRWRSMLDGWKHRMAERAKRDDLRCTGGTPEQASFHCRAYHRHFEGYTEVKRVNERGRTVIERIYTGKYYEPELEPFRRLTLRLFYLLFFAGGLALFLFCATRTTPCNYTPYVNLFQALSMPMLLWCIYVLISYIPSTGKLTIGEYNSLHKPLIRSTLLAAVCIWLSGAGALVCFFLRLKEGVLTDLLCAGGFAVSGGLVFLIALLESHLKYKATNSGTQPPDEVVSNLNK